MSFSKPFNFGFSSVPRLGWCPVARRVHQAGVSQNDRLGGFCCSDAKGNRIQPHRTRRAFTWTVDTITRSYMRIRKSTRTIHILSNKIFTAIARGIRMRPGNSREVKPKGYSRPRDLSRHMILEATSPRHMIMKNWYKTCLHSTRYKQNKRQDN